MYKTQLQENMAALTAALFELYGSRWDFYQILERLESVLAAAKKSVFFFDSFINKYYLR